jgi:hypothetical protein
VAPDPDDLVDLPGGDLVRQGLDDLAGGLETSASLLVGIGRPRLAALGLPLPGTDPPGPPEHRLYALLAADDARTAHARYNALVARLVSFEQALFLAELGQAATEATNCFARSPH